MKDVSLFRLHDLSVLMAEDHASMPQPLTRTLGLFFNEALCRLKTANRPWNFSGYIETDPKLAFRSGNSKSKARNTKQ